MSNLTRFTLAPTCRLTSHGEIQGRELLTGPAGVYGHAYTTTWKVEHPSGAFEARFDPLNPAPKRRGPKKTLAGPMAVWLAVHSFMRLEHLSKRAACKRAAACLFPNNADGLRQVFKALEREDVLRAAGQFCGVQVGRTSSGRFCLGVVYLDSVCNEAESTARGWVNGWFWQSHHPHATFVNGPFESGPNTSGHGRRIRLSQSDDVCLVIEFTP